MVTLWGGITRWSGNHTFWPCFLYMNRKISNAFPPRFPPASLAPTPTTDCLAEDVTASHTTLNVFLYGLALIKFERKTDIWSQHPKKHAPPLSEALLPNSWTSTSHVCWMTVYWMTVITCTFKFFKQGHASLCQGQFNDKSVFRYLARHYQRL